MLGQDSNPFSFLSAAIVDSFCQAQDQTRRKNIISLMKSVNGIVKPFKVVNELMCALQKESFFKSIENNFRVLSEICQKMAMRHFKKNQTIYQLGEIADYFYFVLSGTVNLTVPQELEGISSYQKDTIKGAVKGSMKAFLEKDNPFQKILTVSDLQTSPCLEKILRVIYPGQGFGQMLQNESLRESNAHAAEDCRVLCLKRATYEILLQAQLKTEGHERYTFMKELPLFKNISSYALSRICLLMKEEYLTYGQSLFDSGDPINKIYVVLTGQFKLSKKICKKSLSGIKLAEPENKRVNDEKKNAEYLVVEKGEVLGDYQVISSQKYYQQTCICEQQEGTLLSIDKEQFLRIVQDDEADFATVKKVALKKNVWKSRVVSSFVQRRSRNSFMNVYLHDPKRSYASVCKKKQQSMNKLKSQVSEDFFYNNMNKTIVQNPNKHRFSISRRGKCKTETNQTKNLFTIRNKPKEKVPHGIQDIVELVRLKTNFQKRFRKQKRIKYLFKFNEQDAPLYIKSRFNRVS